MGTIVPQTQNKDITRPVNPRKSFADTKRWISNMFYQELNRHMQTDEGEQITFAQEMVRDTVRMATDPEEDAYVKLATRKFIIEHMEGKAGTMADDKHEEMPKLVICVDDTSQELIRKSLAEVEGAEPEEDIVVEISDENGDNREGYIV